MAADRYYDLPTVHRDEVIKTLRKRGMSYAKIGKVVGMSAPGVCRALERIAEGRPGRDSRA